MGNPAIPTIVKHMTVAIYREGKIPAKTRKDRFLQCFVIAKARCSQYGFIVVQGKDTIALTGKGRAAELRHKSEGRSKTVLFDTLYDAFDMDGKKAAAAKKLQEETAAREAQAKQDNAIEKKATAPQPAAKKPAAPAKGAPTPKAPAKPKIKPYSKKDLL
jgi:hypothetical protein